jgi:hypothetical protein
MKEMKFAPKDGQIITVYRKRKDNGKVDCHRARYVLDPFSIFRPNTKGWQTIDGKWIEVPLVDLIGWE